MAAAGSLSFLLFALTIFVFGDGGIWASATNVTYDQRALIIDGKRRILVSGAIHYPRAVPEMWEDLILKAKDGGLDAIETYVFWDRHEPSPGTYNFEGRYDLPKFLKLVQKAGLYVILRIGPYACAEWNFGGFPVWLLDIPGIHFRTNNEPFKRRMQSFVKKVVNLMKEHKLFAPQGGPIILAQIENEYGNIEWSFGAPGKQYMLWAANMARGLDIGVPWIMCQQSDAPEYIINTCNGYYCDGWMPNAANKPKMWTEDWSGWFGSWGEPVPHRPVEDLAFAVARFFERRGSLQNYYMYFGGTNFGRTSGGPYITTSYDYDSPIDEYGQLRQPKWGHLANLHKVLKICEEALVGGDLRYISLGRMQEVISQSATLRMEASRLQRRDLASNGSLVSYPAKISGALVWEAYKEPVRVWGGKILKTKHLLEQISVTKDTTDYLWYRSSLQVSPEDLLDATPVIEIESMRDVVHIFVNGELAGSTNTKNVGLYAKATQPVNLNAGDNEIDILSVTVGLQNYGAFFETWGAGIRGPVLVRGLATGVRNLTNQLWKHEIGVKGEALKLYTREGAETVTWVPNSLTTSQPLVWYKGQFDAPEGDEPVALDLGGMGKGLVWVNGKSLGRYWPAFRAPQNGCSQKCDYRGPYGPSKCVTGCGQPSQQWYHIPRAWLEPTGNFLVLFEEIGGDISNIQIVTRSTNSVCSYISDAYPPPVSMWLEHINSKETHKKLTTPMLELQCPTGNLITDIKFASYGNPQGACGSFKKGSCHAESTLLVVKQACMGQESCSLTLSWKTFGVNPCPGLSKSLAVEAICRPPASDIFIGDM
ncbi:hypothetical protein O6H91_06G067100 [Diphasiastrum complanatum]|uniref:Uncharacterized protein n=1 Tax=Diphasiastrum complanatum TaxID=34168 RepID=A0ACC2DEQ6_DIPCM|nr:hypothetical protein O6H91_06G067100 [Diphasiastrum complanatum]